MSETKLKSGKRLGTPDYAPDGKISQSWLVRILAVEFWRIGASDDAAEKMLNWALCQFDDLELLWSEKIHWDCEYHDPRKKKVISLLSRGEVSYLRLYDVVLEYFKRQMVGEFEAETMAGLIFYNFRHLNLIREDRIRWRE